MRLRNVPGAREAMVESEYVVNEPKEYKGRWNELFGNSNRCCSDSIVFPY